MSNKDEFDLLGCCCGSSHLDDEQRQALEDDVRRKLVAIAPAEVSIRVSGCSGGTIFTDVFIAECAGPLCISPTGTGYVFRRPEQVCFDPPSTSLDEAISALVSYVDERRSNE